MKQNWSCTFSLLMAAPLGIALRDGQLSDQDAAELAEECQNPGGPCQIERFAWLALFEAARLSIEHRAAICFA